MNWTLKWFLEVSFAGIMKLQSKNRQSYKLWNKEGLPGACYWGLYFILLGLQSDLVTNNWDNWMNYWETCGIQETALTKEGSFRSSCLDSCKRQEYAQPYSNFFPLWNRLIFFFHVPLAVSVSIYRNFLSLCSPAGVPQFDDIINICIFHEDNLIGERGKS